MSDERTKDIQQLVETALVDQALLGDRRAIRQLIDYLAPVIRKSALFVLYFHRRSRSIACDADDIHQVTMEKLFRSRFESWERARPLRPWVGTVARNSAIDWLRSRREILIESEQIVESEVSDFEELYAHREELEKMFDRLHEELKPDECFLFREVVLKERSYEEISRETGVEASTLHVRMFRLKKRVLAIAMKVREELK